MDLFRRLQSIWLDVDHPFLIFKGNELKFTEIIDQPSLDLSMVREGDVVALIGDFNPISILTLLTLIDKNAIIVPLTAETLTEHEYFFQTASVDLIINERSIKRRENIGRHPLIDELRGKHRSGLVLFSTGTTGRPKAIIHDLTLFLKRFETPRPTLKTINFLLFDHIGGLNTLFHTLFNKGVVISPDERTIHSVLDTCRRHGVEVLPTTPTFLRLMLMSGAIPDRVPECLKIITYGTERMDQPTLDALCKLLPIVDFRQTFGMSEIGILRVKSENRNSLFMRVGGEGVETRVVNNTLEIRSQSRMLGYLNAESPFTKDGWYNTKDIVEEKDGLYKVVGRVSDIINVGGLKFMASEVERVALNYPDVSFAKAFAKHNPITGQHVEMTVQPQVNTVIDKTEFIKFLKRSLQLHMVPKRVWIESVSIGHRFKKF